MSVRYTIQRQVYLVPQDGATLDQLQAELAARNSAFVVQSVDSANNRLVCLITDGDATI